MSASDPPHPRVLLHARDPEWRSRLAALVGGAGAEAADLRDVSDSELLAPSFETVLAQTGGEHCPLDRLLRPPEGDPRPHNGRPLILLTPGEHVGAIAARTARRSHAVVLAEPYDEEELASILRASLAVEARMRESDRLFAELRRANAELDARRREAEVEAMRRTQFLAAVSHDLRTPLWEIALFAQVVQAAAAQPTDPTEWTRLAEGLLSGVTTLRERVDDMFELARLDLGAVKAVDDSFLVQPLLERVLAPFRETCRRRGVAFAVEVDPPWAEIHSDAAKLARIVQNLASNAAKFTDSGEVRVTAHAAPPRGLAITVRDTGRGVAPAALATIFDAFIQLDNPERDPLKGTGLGLALCGRLAAVLGGSIDVESEPGRGSAFTLHLPGVARREWLSS